jgi:hypothetical protein
MAAALSGALALGSSRTAQAICQAEPYGLLWSHPGNGAQEVPIDADLFVNGQLNGSPSLAGVPLPRIAAGVYDLGPLEPQTSYEIRWEGAAIVFTTGSATAPAPREPASDVRVTRNPVDFAGCPLVPPQGCFDTDQHTAVRFDAGPALAWRVDVRSCDGSVRQMLWPSACGVPVVESEDRIVCASSSSTQGAGFSEPSGVVCSVPDVPLDTIPRNSGCLAAWPPEGALTLAADDGVTLGSLGGPVTSPDEPSAQPEPAAGCALAPAASGRVAADIAGAAGAGLAALTMLCRWRARARDPSTLSRRRVIETT